MSAMVFEFSLTSLTEILRGGRVACWREYECIATETPDKR
jgi:hypothetical protein